jgi:hypothetical protein
MEISTQSKTARRFPLSFPAHDTSNSDLRGAGEDSPCSVPVSIGVAPSAMRVPRKSLRSLDMKKLLRCQE